MLELQSSYGKTIHTWAFDIHPDLPLGPPNLMMSYTDDGQGPPPQQVMARDERAGTDTAAKRKLREGYLPAFAKSKDADEWVTTGKGVVFEPREVDMKV